MAASRQRSYIFESLLQCKHCGSPMRLLRAQQGTDDLYRCTRTKPTIGGVCAAPDVRAGLLETYLIQEITELVMTTQNVGHLQEHLKTEYSGSIDLDPATLIETATDPLTFNAKDSIANATKMMAKFIRKITVQGSQAIIHYGIPLPTDSRGRGQDVQKVNLPAHVIT